MRLGGFQTPSGHFGKERHSLPLYGFEFQTVLFWLLEELTLRNEIWKPVKKLPIFNSKF
jgi:hypothetical protein